MQDSVRVLTADRGRSGEVVLGHLFVTGWQIGHQPLAILCLGHVEAFYPAPMLELEG